MPAPLSFPHPPADDSWERVAGVDVGAKAFWCVALDRGAQIVDATRLAEPGDVVAWAADQGAPAAGVDSPGGCSAAPYAGDESVNRKFRNARGCEVVLGRDYGIWVPWPAPTDPATLTAWMARGIALYPALEAAGVTPLEVYPYGVFRLLAAATRLPRKTTGEGRAARLDLLERAGVTGLDDPDVRRSHDFLDATAAALVALDFAHGRARRAACELDGTALWLPAAVPEAAGPPLGRR